MSLSIAQEVNLYGKMLLWIYLLIMAKTCNLYYANLKIQSSENLESKNLPY